MRRCCLDQNGELLELTGPLSLSDKGGDEGEPPPPDRGEPDPSQYIPPRGDPLRRLLLRIAQALGMTGFDPDSPKAGDELDATLKALRVRAAKAGRPNAMQRATDAARAKAGLGAIAASAGTQRPGNALSRAVDRARQAAGLPL